jgi:hypothetical protein
MSATAFNRMRRLAEQAEAEAQAQAIAPQPETPAPAPKVLPTPETTEQVTPKPTTQKKS